MNSSTHVVSRFNGTTYDPIGDTVSQIGVTGDGTLYVLNYNNHGLYRYNGTGFTQVGDSVSQLAVTGDGTLDQGAVAGIPLHEFRPVLDLGSTTDDSDMVPGIEQVPSELATDLTCTGDDVPHDDSSIL